MTIEDDVDRDGVVLLTSNSQARFDDAFSRRLDFIIDFPPPGPAERRALWQSHLGPDTTLTAAELNQLAVLLDLNGGQTRNVVLAAAVLARAAGRCIEYADASSTRTSSPVSTPSCARAAARSRSRSARSDPDINEALCRCADRLPPPAEAALREHAPSLQVCRASTA